MIILRPYRTLAIIVDHIQSASNRAPYVDASDKGDDRESHFLSILISFQQDVDRPAKNENNPSTFKYFGCLLFKTADMFWDRQMQREWEETCIPILRRI